MLWSILSGIFGASASSMIKLATSTSTGSSAAAAAATTTTTMTTEPLMYIHRYVCEDRAWLVDFDETFLRIAHRILGDFATGRYPVRINLMMYWKTVKDVVQLMFTSTFPFLFDVDYCQLIVIIPIRILLIVAMVVLNAYMIAAFLRGIQESGSVVGTALSTASNFITSVVLGVVVWNEHERMNATWYVGFSCVLLGVLMLSNVHSVSDDATQDRTTVNRSNKKNNDNNGDQSDSSSKNTKKKNETIIARPKISVMETVQNMNNSGSSTKKKNTESNNNALTASHPRWNLRSRKQESETAATTAAMATSSTVTLSKKSYEKKSKKDLKPESSLEQYYNNSSRKMLKMSTATAPTAAVQTPLTERGFLNECILCEGRLFDQLTGESVDDAAVADLSCHHVVHSSCLKQAAKSLDNSCPICTKPLSMFTSTKQAASCSGFWIQRVEDFLINYTDKNALTTTTRKECLPASVVREHFYQLPESTLTKSQKQYIEDDPSGMGKGLQSALEWGGCRDYNDSSVQRGRVGYDESLRTRGLWKYDTKKDDVWFWGWGDVHPRQRCDQCQLINQTTVPCHGCQGSSQSAHYCSDVCAKRDRQRHKQTCQKWQNLNIPKS